MGVEPRQVLHPGLQLWVPLDGFKMQTAGVMVYDSHHVPSTGLEALVVVSRYSIVGLEELAPVLLSLDRVRLGHCNHWHQDGGGCDLIRVSTFDQFEVSADEA